MAAGASRCHADEVAAGWITRQHADVIAGHGASGGQFPTRSAPVDASVEREAGGRGPG